MLSEFDNVRQIHGEDRRRLFTDVDFALYIWYRRGEISGFQLCYDRQGAEKAFMWTLDHGYAHYAVDSGEGEGLAAKKTPVFTSESAPIPIDLGERFAAVCGSLEEPIRGYVLGKLENYPAGISA